MTRTRLTKHKEGTGKMRGKVKEDKEKLLNDREKTKVKVEESLRGRILNYGELGEDTCVPGANVQL